MAGDEAIVDIPEISQATEATPLNSHIIVGRQPSQIRKTSDIKFPNGKNSLNQTREVRLSDPYYFVQRLRNCDPRFSNDTSYLFAAACYLEKKALQQNINISYQRGKKTKGADGKISYKLDDGFNVFDKIPNTPKYWKQFRHEMMAKLDNLGPFQFFFTLSCADRLFKVSESMTNFVLTFYFTGKFCCHFAEDGH